MSRDDATGSDGVKRYLALSLGREVHPIEAIAALCRTSVTGVAEVTGIHRATLTKIIRGYAPTPDDIAQRLAAHFKVEKQFFLGPDVTLRAVYEEKPEEEEEEFDPIPDLCCRECGEWKPLCEFDPDSVFFNDPNAGPGIFALKFDLDTPLCAECSAKTPDASEW